MCVIEKLNHNPWLAQLHFSFQDNHSLYMALEFCGGMYIYFTYKYLTFLSHRG